MDPWKQGFVMPQVAGTELLVAGMAHWLRFNPHKESHFRITCEPREDFTKSPLVCRGCNAVTQIITSNSSCFLTTLNGK